MRSANTKRAALRFLPYLLIGLVATHMGEAWRLSAAHDPGLRIMGFIELLPQTFGHVLPSLDPFDLMVGCLTALLFRLIVYLKSLDTKTYRKGIEYGSARWGTKKDIAPFIDPVFQNNVILTQTEFLTMESRPKNPAYARNKNVLIIGGSGSGKTRFWLLPNLLQMHSSYVLSDPKGELLRTCGYMLLKNHYKVRIFNTIEFSKSQRYNPFVYIHSEKDILKLVNALIANTKGDGRTGDDFWLSATRSPAVRSWRTRNVCCVDN